MSLSISAAELAYCEQHGIALRRKPAGERLRQILSFRSSPHLYHAECVLTGKRIVTVVPPDSGYSVYDAAASTELNAEQYGRPYDFSRGFFAQFAELLRTVPFYSRVGVFSSNENSDYCQGVAWSKNCYLCFRASRAEDCLYSRYIRTGRDLVDCIWCIESELAYSCADITRCYDLAFSDHCQDCSSSRFLYDCTSCRDCFCCVGLSGAQYCFENKQLTESEYRARMLSVNLERRSACDEWRAKLYNLRSGNANRLFLDRCENSTGDHLVGCAGALNCYFSFDSYDIEHCIGVQKLHSSFFCSGLGANSEQLYCCEAVGDQAYDIKFSLNCMSGVQHLEYCLNVCNGSTHCFGCVGLRRSSYMILNRSYSKEEYLSLVARIKEQMRAAGEYGEFFPLNLSPFAFNRSEAFDFLPLSENEAVGYGYRWQPEEPLEPAEVTDLPDSLDDVSDDVLSQRFRCLATNRLFTVQSKELEFHRRMGLALSPYSPLERLYLLGKLICLDKFTKL